VSFTRWATASPEYSIVSPAAKAAAMGSVYKDSQIIKKSSFRVLNSRNFTGSVDDIFFHVFSFHCPWPKGHHGNIFRLQLNSTVSCHAVATSLADPISHIEQVTKATNGWDIDNKSLFVSNHQPTKKLVKGTNKQIKGRMLRNSIRVHKKLKFHASVAYSFEAGALKFGMRIYLINVVKLVGQIFVEELR